MKLTPIKQKEQKNMNVSVHEMILQQRDKSTTNSQDGMYTTHPSK